MRAAPRTCQGIVGERAVALEQHWLFGQDLGWRLNFQTQLLDVGIAIMRVIAFIAVVSARRTSFVLQGVAQRVACITLVAALDGRRAARTQLQWWVGATAGQNTQAVHKGGNGMLP
jgi:hypothetical protein